MLDDESVRKIQKHLRDEMRKLEKNMAGQLDLNDPVYNFSSGEHHACYVLSRLISALKT